METHYKRHVATIWEESQNLGISDSAHTHNQFTFFSANLEHFLPLVPVAEHSDLFRKTIAHQRLSGLDLPFGISGYLPHITGWDPDWASGLGRQPRIITCAHAGAHMLIGLLLAKAGVPLVLLAASHLMERLAEIWQNAAGTYPSLVLPRIVDASSSGALRQLIRCAQEGISLLIYWDGEEGHGGRDDSGNRICMPLLGQHILMNRGIAFLAQKTRLPIQPMVSFRQLDGSVGIDHGTEISAEDHNPKNFPDYAMRTITAHFSSKLIHFPTQWHKWTHLQRLVMPERYFIEPGRPLSERFGILKGAKTYYLFEKRSYKTIELTENELPLSINPS